MAEEQQQQGNIRAEYNNATVGMNMDNTVNQVPKGALTYALNASVENFDSSSVNYQNEPGNEFCLNFPEGLHLIGEHFINEKNKHIFFLVNPDTGDSQIGYMDNNDCVYRIYIDTPCLNFNIDNPIHKIVHKITNCTTEIYWTDGLNARRYLDVDNIESVYTVTPGTDVCDNQTIPVVDCNKLKVQPNFDIPNLAVVDVTTGGELRAGTYQFAIQYCDADGAGYTSYYSVTNPTPIANIQITTPNFDYVVGRSIVLDINNIDITGYYQYFNIAVIKTINAITSVELVGTYFIDRSSKQITYTGQNQEQIRLTINDIFEKFPYYDIAQDLTTVQDILVWDNLTSVDRINYQGIANQIDLLWETYRIPATENYADELNATNLRGYLRDEVYAFEIVFLLRNGKQTDGFHIPGRVKNSNEVYPDVPNTNPDFIDDPSLVSVPYWKVYNTASVTGFSPGYSSASDYKGPYQYGQFAYWESTELYPCNEAVWGELANQPIRHHKFPDVLVSPIFESKIYSGPSGMVMGNDAVFPIGVKIDSQQIVQLINISSLTQEQKNDIVGYKIVRGDRSTNKSIVAKGILRNVGKYTREETEFYYPNYPYNDVKPDVFVQSQNNAFLDGCETYKIVATSDGEIQYTDCFTGEQTSMPMVNGETYEICSLSFPIVPSPGTTSYLGVANYKRYRISNYTGQPGCGPAFDAFWYFKSPTSPSTLSVIVVHSSGGPFGCTPPYCCGSGSPYDVCVDSIIPPSISTALPCNTVTVEQEIKSSKICNASQTDPLKGFEYAGTGYRYVFNSPETSFGQPFLGNVLKLENAIFGAGSAHFVEVRKNAFYKLLTKEAQQDALNDSYNVGTITGTGTNFSASAMFAAYQAYLTIYINGITRKNYAYSFNSIADYNYGTSVANGLGIKQRNLDIAQYIIPGVQNVGDDKNINNWNRESSVYLRTTLSKNALPFVEQSPNVLALGVTDNSRFTISEVGNCLNPGKEMPIAVTSYYGSLKNTFINQWGQIYSYQTIDTGFQKDITPISNLSSETVFGGDTFISRFAFKTKLPFFIDNRVGAPDDSDIFYDEIGNVAYPKYWHSARSVLADYTQGSVDLVNFISYKAHNFDCPNNQLPAPPAVNPNRTFYDGKFYLFAYGIPNFYCESSINTDLRQAFNNREGDFWPHVSTGIPDDWMQESFVTIAQDNTYFYNVTFSKQNKENFFSHLPVDWEQKLCFTYFPFRAIYSDVQQSYTSNEINSWLIYRPVSFFDFPQNYGNLTSLDGIQNRAVLARFENKSLMYNNLLTIDTSNPQAAYVGNNKLFAGAPPIDFAETDLGYVGSQNKFLLKIPQGQITIDAKRGQVFLISGTQATDLSSFGSGMNRFFTDHLAFEILRYFPDVDTDNHFNGVGLHGVYDSKYDRVIISKLDYIPLFDTIKYNDVTKEFYIEENLGGNVIKTVVELTDVEYFCNKSWTLSFNFNTKSWVSFHSYIPNWYIAENNFFYSGLNGGCDLEAIAAEEVPFVPTTTTSTTQRITTTTSTTTVFINCTIEGYAVVRACELAGTAIDVTPTTTTTSTSSTSTTTTTTTICVNCDTYSIQNVTALPVSVDWTYCNGQTFNISIPAFSTIYQCACDIPDPIPEGLVISMTQTGCYTCFCYTITNTNTITRTASWVSCTGTSSSFALAPSQSISVCAVPGSLSLPTGVTSTGGTFGCTSDVDCQPET
jgi:hypothetical protein